MKTTKHYFLIVGLVIMSITSCKKNDPPPSIPQLTTFEVTDIAIPAAKSGGIITSNGGRNLTAVGLCWSKTNQTPTISNDTSKIAASSGSFTGSLKNIEPSSTYYVRAYATNEVGTGYGNVVTFTTGNGGPEARGIEIAGNVEVLGELTASYTYFDHENDAEGGTSIQWYRANDASGTGEVAISNATELTYSIKDVDEFKYLRVSITAKAHTGTTPGIQAKSAFVGPVAAEPNTITFTYNGTQVTYGILISEKTGRRWLDRNLGASASPTSYDDYVNYGDLFQWGRGADGHQIVTRAESSGATIGVSTTNTLSSSNVPPDSKFILPTASPRDWRSPQNPDLWQGLHGTNNPCPSGWRIPTYEEWETELTSIVEDDYDLLKITLGGYRDGYTGNISSVGYSGFYWSSSKDGVLAIGVASALGGTSLNWTDFRASALMVRCIKN